MSDELPKRLVPDELWEPVEPLLPDFVPRTQGWRYRAGRPAGAFHRGGVHMLSDLCVADAATFFDRTAPTAHRWFTIWTEAGL
ncbi:hypothetical protein ACIHAX_37480 [Nocardia sp. NPDC051929]|uniref:hypothetical protein n=1 Tax=unclassified Nocardia TaxID=2637762 RepID=UPI00342E5003